MDANKLREKFENEEENEDYIGNIWGWKFSLIGLGVLLFMAGLMIYGQLSGKVNYLEAPPPQEIPAEAHPDSIKKNH